MKKKRRCNLCGAKLKGDICSECGYNNAAYDYKVNTSENYCSHSSTEQFYNEQDHDHHTDTSFDGNGASRNKAGANAGNSGAEPAQDSWDYSQMEIWADEMRERNEGADSDDQAKTYGWNEAGTSGKGNTTGKKKRGKALVLVIVLIWLVPTVVELILGIVGEMSYENSWETLEGIFQREDADDLSDAGENGIGDSAEAETADEQAGSAGASDGQKSVAADMTSVGGAYQAELGPGFYVAGLHIPAGRYNAVLVSGSGSCMVRNPELSYWESSYLYEDGGKSDREMKKLELEPGTMIQISDDLHLEFSTKKNEGYLPGTENHLTDDVEVTDGMVAGEDFPAGTYHVRRVSVGEETGSLLYKYQASYGREEYELIELQAGRAEYQNLILKDGDILLTLNCDIRLEPAEYDLGDYEGIW